MKLLKKIFNKRFIGILLAIVILINVVSPNIVTPKSYAVDALGIILWPLSALVAGLAQVAIELLSELFKVAQVVAGVGGGGTANEELFIDKIVFNKIPAFQANIFDLKDGAMIDNSSLGTIQEWYYITRTIAIAASFVILIYVAIQIFISTAAGDKAKYKTLLKDWALSLLLIFVMHFIMAAILFAADSFTNVIAGLAEKVNSNKSAYDALLDLSLAGNTNSILYAVLLWILIGATIAFTFIYTKRTLMIAFLTIFAPLVALSYSVDKIKDGKSQVLDAWMKEYIYTALMMPLDAILYAIISSLLLNNLQDGGNFVLAAGIVLSMFKLRGMFNEFLGTNKAKHAGAGDFAKGFTASKMIDSFKKSGGKSSGKGGGNTSNENGAGENDNRITNENRASLPDSQESNANPAISGGTDTPRVTSPESGALPAEQQAAQSNELSAGQQAAQSNELSAGQQAAQNSRRKLTGGVTSTLKKGAQIYGKTAGIALNAAAIAMAAGTGNSALAGRVAGKVNFNGNNEYGAIGGMAGGIKSGVNATKSAVKATKSAVQNMPNVMSGIGGAISTGRQERRAINETLSGNQSSVEEMNLTSEQLSTYFDSGFDQLSDDEYEDMQLKVDTGLMTEDERDVEIVKRGIKANKGAMISQAREQGFDKSYAEKYDKAASIKKEAKKVEYKALADGISKKEAKAEGKSAKKRLKNGY